MNLIFPISQTSPIHGSGIADRRRTGICLDPPTSAMDAARIPISAAVCPCGLAGYIATLRQTGRSAWVEFTLSEHATNRRPQHVYHRPQAQNIIYTVYSIYTQTHNTCFCGHSSSSDNHTGGQWRFTVTVYPASNEHLRMFVWCSRVFCHFQMFSLYSGNVCGECSGTNILPTLSGTFVEYCLSIRSLQMFIKCTINISKQTSIPEVNMYFVLQCGSSIYAQKCCNDFTTLRDLLTNVSLCTPLHGISASIACQYSLFHVKQNFESCITAIHT